MSQPQVVFNTVAEMRSLTKTDRKTGNYFAIVRKEAPHIRYTIFMMLEESLRITLAANIA